MRTLSGSFDLDETSAVALRARRLRLLQRGAAVTGRFGRRGVIHGHAANRTLTAVLSDDGEIGLLELTFDPALASFEGTFLRDDRAVAIGGRRSGRRRSANPMRHIPPN